MGEAPACFLDDFQDSFPNGLDLKSKSCEATCIIGERTYFVGGRNDDSKLSIEVHMFDQSTGRRVEPIVLGTKPKTSKRHSAVALDKERILIIKEGSVPDDSIWFLEVDTPYVREQKRILESEVVAWSRGVCGNSEKHIVISGPSGVGKGTLISMLMKDFPSMFGFSVSHTTRAPRNMEKDGIHYHFTERSVMEKAIKEGKFLEFASVHGNLYGTSIEAVEVVADERKRCILDIDVQGAKSVRASSIEAVFIFICPPSMEELEKRLRARGTETEEHIMKRIRNAEEEIKEGHSSHVFDHILYNDNLDDCYTNLKKLLGLDGNITETPEPIYKGFDFSTIHSVSKIGQKIIIKGETQEMEKEARNWIVLDLSSLKGGAPGRTRGLEYSIVSKSNDFNGINLS